MTTLYYGNGNCTLEGSDIRAIQIRYKGTIEITDKTSASFAIAASDNVIVVFPIGIGTLNELFDYKGNFKIISAQAANSNAGRVAIVVRKVMDYSELLGTSESLTTKSEDLRAGYKYGKGITKTSIIKKIIPNLHTSNYKELYLEDGNIYVGDMHIHLEKGMGIMTGSTHTRESRNLYYNRKDKLIATKNFKPKKRKSRKGGY